VVASSCKHNYLHARKADSRVNWEDSGGTGETQARSDRVRSIVNVRGYKAAKGEPGTLVVSVKTNNELGVPEKRGVVECQETMRNSLVDLC
jgi:hypothetical protein